MRARLGTLERQVIEAVWAGGEVTVRDIHATLDDKVAYTTVMTTLDRLFRKGLLVRTKRSRAFVYSALASREELDDIVASDVVSGLLAGEWWPRSRSSRIWWKRSANATGPCSTNSSGW